MKRRSGSSEPTAVAAAVAVVAEAARAVGAAAFPKSQYLCFMHTCFITLVFLCSVLLNACSEVKTLTFSTAAAIGMLVMSSVWLSIAVISSSEDTSDSDKSVYREEAIVDSQANTVVWVVWRG